MLKYLQIVNFAIIKKLELDFGSGLTVVTGETGAGKSIIIDALEIVLGSRTDPGIIRADQDKCEMTACFAISHIESAQEWLNAHDYDHENECLIRRILHKDGRSKVTINGTACSLQQVREFSLTLISIHSQNQQQLLLKKNYQREILDKFGNHKSLCQQINAIYTTWRDLNQQLQKLSHEKQQSISLIELYRYQLDELNKLALQENEYLELDQEQKTLANAEKIIHSCQQTLLVLKESEPHNAIKLLNQSIYHLQSISHPKVSESTEFIQNACIQLNEAITLVRNFLASVELNPERLQSVENRLEKIHELARKHQVNPEELYTFHQQLQSKLQKLLDSDTQSHLLEKQLSDLQNQYHEVANSLSKARYKTAQKLDSFITEKIQCLGLPGGIFQVKLNPTASLSPEPHGNENVEFLISTNPGNPLQALHKIVSGGELSRIALAIYVTIAETHTAPILIFDEIDVGIGGSTAAIVGKLLKTLAQTSQILCITHLPQVASYGHHHLRVKKQIDSNQTSTILEVLNAEEKVQEVARMLGGVKVTEKTLAHARELLEEQ